MKQERLQNPPHQNQKFKLQLSEKGSVNFEGELTKETQEIVQQALQQAEYYKQKAAQLESEKIKQNTEFDSIVIVFVSCVLALLLFGSFMIVSSIRNAFIQQGVTNVR